MASAHFGKQLHVSGLGRLKAQSHAPQMFEPLLLCPDAIACKARITTAKDVAASRL